MTIDVFIRTHDRKNLLTKAIFSVINQSKKPSNIFILDDLNQFKVKNLILNFKKNFKNIHYINTKNNFNSLKNLNIQIKKSKSNVLAFLDDDDTWNKEYLKINYKLLQNYDIIYNNFYELFDNKKKKFEIKKKKFSDNIITNNGFLISNLTIKRTVFNKQKGFDSSIGSSADKDFYLRALNNKLKIFFQKSPLVNYTVFNRKLNWKWSEDYHHTLGSVLKFYYKYFFNINIDLHVKMIIKVFKFITLGFKK